MTDKLPYFEGTHEPASREIYTNQQGVHDNLERIVLKHLSFEFKKPPAQHTATAFNEVAQHIATKPALPIILDSCCGTGLSSRRIAAEHTNAWVIGIDRSAKRLNKEEQETLPPNCIIVQADCVDFWKLANEAGWQLEKHFLLYPNPYPKSVQLKYRWHGHPALADLLTLGGLLEVRSNWKIYIEEFSEALRLAKQKTAGCEVYEPRKDSLSAGVIEANSKHPVTRKLEPAEAYLTLFERKYHQSGQTLYRCLSRLSFGHTR